MTTQLLTFGCSWTFGVGAYWTPTSDPLLHLDNAHSDESKYNAARSILSRQYSLNNKNFSRGGQSNYYNFRKLREYIVNNDHDDLVVLFGITSTARNEYFVPATNKFQRIKFNDSEAGSLNDKFFINSYSHENEVRILEEQMQIWNDLLDHYNIPVVWYDTFNTHDYSCDIKNLLPEDLLTLMIKKENIKCDFTGKWYHLSSWHNDDPRITAGVDNGLLNPVSFHPTKRGQEIIAEILKPDLEKFI